MFVNTVFIQFFFIFVGLVAFIWILRKNIKYYGILYVIASIVAIGLCVLFISLKLYSFQRMYLLNGIPLFSLLLTFPVGVMFAVRYSPEQLKWKIPFYWGIVHIGVFMESILETRLEMIVYHEARWDLWDSYTWWWIYFLFLEWVGGKVIPQTERAPIDQKSFRYGQWGWLILHLILISTIFFAGYYVGRIS